VQKERRDPTGYGLTRQDRILKSLGVDKDILNQPREKREVKKRAHEEVYHFERLLKIGRI